MAQMIIRRTTKRKISIYGGVNLNIDPEASGLIIEYLCIALNDNEFVTSKQNSTIQWEPKYNGFTESRADKKEL